MTVTVATQRLRRGVVSTYVVRAVSVGTLVILFPLVARSGGMTLFGAYLLFTCISVLLQADLGLGSTTVTRLAQALHARDSEGSNRLATASVAMFAGMGVVAGILFLLVTAATWDSLDIPPSARPSAAWIAVLAGSQCVITLAGAANRHMLAADDRLDVANWIQVAAAAGRIVGTLIVLRVDAGIVWVAVVDTLAVAAIAAGTWIWRRRLTPVRVARSAFEPRSLLVLLKWNMPMLAMSVAALILLQSANLLVSVTAGVAAVAVFSAGFRVYQLCKEATGALVVALLPHAARVADDADQVRALFLRATRSSNALLCAAALPVLSFGDQLVSAWAGAGLAEGGRVALWLVVGLLAGNNHLVALPILTAMDRLGVFVWLHATWAVTALAAGFALGSLYGPVGVAAAISIPAVLLEPFYVRHTLSTLGVTWSEFVRTAIAPHAVLLTAATIPAIAVLRPAIGPSPHLVLAVVLAAALSASYLALSVPLVRSIPRASAPTGGAAA
ncbi:O-antigen/teichoic acid export membrane protein [Nocardioides thalensis]|uniref:O-antigen/teichoic acid export membrane protein n=1 Tax=Nocardioides thalensis TaxID=1914755 RepID=A0A853C5V1_9ACTN|nr:hypothetical protein [Nocardioides thalensis]NYJ02844.1 O-antigen/teichoic acid export membrane protein [Nocardioides thalensis]